MSRKNMTVSGLTSKECSPSPEKREVYEVNMMYNENEDGNLKLNRKSAWVLHNKLKQCFSKLRNNLEIVLKLEKKLVNADAEELYKYGSVRLKTFKGICQMFVFSISAIEDANVAVVKQYKDFIMQLNGEVDCCVESSASEESCDSDNEIFLPRNRKKSKEDLESGVESSETWYTEGEERNTVRKLNKNDCEGGRFETDGSINMFKKGCSQGMLTNTSLAEIHESTSKERNKVLPRKKMQLIKDEGNNSRINCERNKSEPTVEEWLNGEDSNRALKLEESSDEFESPSLLVEDANLNLNSDDSVHSSINAIYDTDDDNPHSIFINSNSSLPKTEKGRRNSSSEDEREVLESANVSKIDAHTKNDIYKKADKSCTSGESDESDVEYQRAKEKLLNSSSDETETSEIVKKVNESVEEVDNEASSDSDTHCHKMTEAGDSNSDLESNSSKSRRKNKGWVNVNLNTSDECEDAKEDLPDASKSTKGSSKVKVKVQARHPSLSSSASESSTDCENPKHTPSTSPFELQSDDNSSSEKTDEQGKKESPGSTRKCSSEDENAMRDIERLTNLKNLKSVTPKKSASENSVKKKTVKSDKEKSQTLLDFIELSSDEDSELSDNLHDDSVSPHGLDDETNYNATNSNAKDALERISSSDEDESSNKDGLKNVGKGKQKLSDSASSTSEVKIKKEETVSDEGSSKSKQRKKWQNDRLLRMKLSETESSDDTEADAGKKKAKKNTPKKRKKSSPLSESGIISLSSEDEFDMRKIKRERESSENSSDQEKKKRKRTKNVKEEFISLSSSDDSDCQIISPLKKLLTPVKGRKNIKEIIEDANVMPETRLATKEEEARCKRIAEKEKIYSQAFEPSQSQGETGNKIVLDFDEKTLEELVVVNSGLTARLKSHQVEGVKFMWNACFETVKMSKENGGSGCILAHCMGLGKTFQVITLVHTVLYHKELNVKTVLILCPLSTVLNWMDEFRKWLRLATVGRDVSLYTLRGRKSFERSSVLDRWHNNGGVMIMGYELFRSLCSTDPKNLLKTHEIYRKTLLDSGPDIIICDEGHVLKNDETGLSKTINKVKTKRRIVLTGTPLQNNLREYYVMVQFVKPNLLGNKKEFRNRFSSPISNGQYENSTVHDVKIMKKRAHVLHKMLESSVQRYDYSILTAQLPTKFEYALSVRLTDLQVQMYQYYLDSLARQGVDEKSVNRTTTLFRDFQQLRKVSTHPRMLLMDLEWRKKMAAGALSSECELDVDMFLESGGKGRRRRKNDISSVSLENIGPADWWQQFMIKGTEMDDIRESGKLVLLFSILKECENRGEKILVFSQSLLALDLIEYFLGRITEANKRNITDEKLGGYMSTWIPGEDYYRLDGSTPTQTRADLCKSFNKEENTRARLFLISTRAGGLGINLYAANRVIIFDASWNPSHDVQSIFRVYRFGQTKPCYFYRFIAEHSMEEKVYSRQVTKLSLSCRVVDEQQIERHYKFDDLQNFYIFDPTEEKRLKTPMVPKDIILAELLSVENSWIDTYHEHDSLLENKEEEELNEDERKAAWEEYEREKQAPFGGHEPLPNWMTEMVQSINEKTYAESSSSVVNARGSYAYLNSEYNIPGVAAAFGAQQAGSGAQQVGSGAQLVGSVAQQAGSVAQQVGSGALPVGSGAHQVGSGAQQVGSGAQPAVFRAQQTGQTSSGSGLPGSGVGLSLSGGHYVNERPIDRRRRHRGRGHITPTAQFANIRLPVAPPQTGFQNVTTAVNYYPGQVNPSVRPYPAVNQLRWQAPNGGVPQFGHVPGRGNTTSGRGQVGARASVLRQGPGVQSIVRQPQAGLSGLNSGEQVIGMMGQPILGRGQTLSGRGQLSGMGQPVSGRGQQLSGMGQQLSGRGQQLSGRGQQLSGRGQQLSGRGQQLSGRGQQLSGRVQQLSGMGQQLSGMGQPVSGMGQPVSGGGQQLSGMGQPQLQSSITKPSTAGAAVMSN